MILLTFITLNPRSCFVLFFLKDICPGDPTCSKFGFDRNRQPTPMMAVRTSDIETVYARLQELGAKFLLHPMKSPDGTQTELVVHDPDGVRIHVVERPDTKFD